MGAKMRGGVVMSIFCDDAPSIDMMELSSVISAQEGSLITRATIALSGALHSICAKSPVRGGHRQRIYPTLMSNS